MKKTVILFSCIMNLLVPPLAIVHGATLDCGSKTISVGDSRIDVLINCGEPDSKESHQEELMDTLDGSLKRKIIITVEEWTYNFGPSQFVRIVTLKNGTIADIRTGGYGTNTNNKPEAPEFSGRIVSPGDATSDVIAKWGEPAWKETRQEEFKEKLDNGLERKTIVTIEEWTYNFGPSRFMRILTFKNGKLVEIRTGDYGYTKHE